MQRSASMPDVDVLIVGSGPVGSAYARLIAEGAPWATVLMVERGPALSDRPGANLKNFLRSGALAKQGDQAPDSIPVVPSITDARSGTRLVVRGPGDPQAMPSAAMSTNVGGMGAHWSCATPSPAVGERVGFIDDAEWRGLLATSRRLLNSSTQAFGDSARGAAMCELLGAEFQPELGGQPAVQTMPHGCARLPDGRFSWTGADTVLGPLAEPADAGAGRFTLRSDTICRTVTLERGRATGAVVEHLGTGTVEQIRSTVTVVAADSFRTPQLLWASGIRPPALGHYLNEHPMVGATALLGDRALDRAAAILGSDDFAADPPAAVWVPYAQGRHQFSGQISHSLGSPAGVAIPALSGVPLSRIISLTWFVAKQVRYQDHISFSDDPDADGMPSLQLHYSLSEADRSAVAQAVRYTVRAGRSFGDFVEGQEPSLLPDGQSLHYMGTARMGERDDGTSVCDPYGRVWGVRGLYVGGNGVIPTSTACNPTLFSVALAARGAADILRTLTAGRSAVVVDPGLARR